MRSEIAAADRRFEVRRAIASWRASGLIGASAEPALAAGFADDRVRTSRIFRVLFFLFTWFGFSTGYGFGLAFFSIAGMSWENGTAFAWLNMAAGGAMLVAAEFLTASRRLRRFGIEEASAWIGHGYLLGGALLLATRGFTASPGLLLVAGAWSAAALATLIVWRWATPGMGLVAALGLFVAISQLPANHLLWLVAAAILALPLATLSRAAHLSPEHRRRFAEAFCVAVLMLYIAVHVEVVEARLFALIRIGSGGLLSNSSPLPTPQRGWLILSIVAMVLVPAALLIAGARRRFRPALDLGLFLAGVTAVSLAARFRLQPLWVVLLVAGGLLVGSALALGRLFARRAGSEWRGLTVLALAEDRESLQTLEVAATLAAFSPAARPIEARSFEGGGGDFGGGGASAKF